MAFCPNCGNSVAAGDRFCGACGSAQPLAAGAAGAGSASTASWQETTAAGLSPRNASVICYVPWIGWIGALFVLATERFRTMRTVRFHAFQGLYMFVAWLLVDLVAKELFRPHWMIGQSLKMALFVGWIYMLVQTANDKLVKLPLLGELADRSVDEQR